MMVSREDEVLHELRRINRLLSVIATQNLSQTERIASLARVGFSPREIAELLETTPNTVSVYLSQARKRKGEKRRTRQSAVDA
jgi:DNA-binding CsgD family transcriptional regulator